MKKALALLFMPVLLAGCATTGNPSLDAAANAAIAAAVLNGVTGTQQPVPAPAPAPAPGNGTVLGEIAAIGSILAGTPGAIGAPSQPAPAYCPPGYVCTPAQYPPYPSGY
ncbi:hypothetical protein RG903_04455 [Thermithiobacillus tepidarius DSM 3134]|uniref:hypothetical protein n=1 Tax=Thermithiobacillus tepidarius TaxID=929 RepID=UPI0003FA42B8|nr:hypothetical protein [Thermithiobacillus tepidarius]